MRVGVLKVSSLEIFIILASGLLLNLFPMPKLHNLSCLLFLFYSVIQCDYVVYNLKLRILLGHVLYIMER